MRTRRKKPRRPRFNGAVMVRASATVGTAAGVQVMDGGRLRPSAWPQPLLLAPTPITDPAHTMARAHTITDPAHTMARVHTITGPALILTVRAIDRLSPRL